jgi:photosystem II stability/assembly factor-like uncharacterized protein
MHMTRATAHIGALTVGLVLAVRPAAQGPNPFTDRLVSGFEYHNLGPFRIGARISDIAVPAGPAKAHLYTFYVSSWSGGVWKTTNSGTTFTPVFDDQSTLSIGDVTLAPSNPDIVWVGTGDAFTSRSSYAGDGVYRSTDAGATWTNMGLHDSQHIARIVIDPADPDVVYVAAMGHLYSNNAERGVFKTTDAGATWQKLLYVNDRVGVIDLAMDPKHTDVLYAAAYDKQRLPWQLVNSGPDSAIYKTTDAGATWTKLGGGLPTGRIGRIGLAVYPKNPDIVYAVVENDNTRPGTQPDAQGRVTTVGGEVYRTDDGGQTWRKMNAASDNVSSKGPYYFSQIRVDPNDDQRIFVTGEELGNSTDGGRTWHDITWPPRHLFSGIFGDVRTLWIDPDNSDRMILGSDGGVFVSYDGGRTSDHYANLPLGEVYAISADNDDPYHIYAGLQDHENWKGPTSTGTGDVTTWNWLAVGDGDGMATVVDPTDSRWLYTSREYGSQSRVDQKLGYRVSIMPRAEQGQPPYRFIWETPIAISPHDSRVIYTGGQALLKSTDRGDHWTAISPDLSTNPTDKILPSSEGAIPGGIPWFAISSISESPLKAGLIWAGTSDGNVQVTRDDGATWTNVTPRLAEAGGRVDAYVSRVVASSHVEGRAYVAKNGYKLDDFTPYLYVTEDYGATWTSIGDSLPHKPVNVVWEDRTNPDLLFVGDDTGVFVSVDRGAHWVDMNNNMPNVAVHDLLVQPTEHDLVLGTYGRGIWVTNIEPLEEMTSSVLGEDVHLFAVTPTVERVTWSFGANDYLFGQRHIVTPNDSGGMVIRYYLKQPAAADPTVTITDAAGQQVARLTGRPSAGINTVVWNMRAGRGGRSRGTGVGRGAGRGGRGANPIDQWAPLGQYTVTLEADGRTLTEKAEITKTQGWPLGLVPEIIR